MKKIAGILLTGFVLLFSFQSRAQSYTESALLFSRTSLGGSARIQSMGGAQVSLGGDYSSSFSNPAGLGMYNRSEFTITPGYNSAKSSSDYLGTSTSDGQSRLIIPGISFVLHTEKNRGILLSGTFGISINRFNDFNRTFSYGGTNNNSSIIDYFVADANRAAQQNNATPAQLFADGGYLRNTPTELAYQNYLVNQSGTYQYAIDSLAPQKTALSYFGVPKQHETVQTRGSQFQISLSYGVNLSDKVFLGGGIGLTSLDYKSRKTYYETFAGDSLLRSTTLVENLHTTGTGINLTIGAIYKPVQFFQAGFSLATPTVYTLSDNYAAGLVADWNHFPYYGNGTSPNTITTNSDQVLASYGLNTPLRLTGGMTFFILKHGFITGDIEYLDYGSTKYSAQVDGGLTNDDTNSFNQDIKSSYKSVFNYKVGGEYRWKNYRVRAGYNYMPDPYKAAQAVNYSIQSISGGLGYRTKKFFVDLTAIMKQNSTSYYPYTYADAVITKHNATTVMMTVGFPF